ncbi:MAG: hypothetical protein ACR2NU_03045 [Aeoliella sp.]
MHRTLAMAWAGPNTLIGLVLGGLALMTGGSAQLHTGVLEFHGGFTRWLLERIAGGTILAMTLGHVVLGLHPVALDISRDHERVHVRQYERWGPLFLPAYGLSSLIVWCQGKRAYRDNFFEREAYERFPMTDDQ